jgi:hypothetical protein
MTTCGHGISMGRHVHTASGSWSGMPVSATLAVDQVVLRLTHDTRTAACWAVDPSVCARRLYSCHNPYTSGTHNRNFGFACVVCWEPWVAERICLHGTLRNVSHDSIRTERNGTERNGTERIGTDRNGTDQQPWCRGSAALMVSGSSQNCRIHKHTHVGCSNSLRLPTRANAACHAAGAPIHRAVTCSHRKRETAITAVSRSVSVIVRGVRSDAIPSRDAPSFGF